MDTAGRVRGWERITQYSNYELGRMVRVEQALRGVMQSNRSGVYAGRFYGMKTTRHWNLALSMKPASWLILTALAFAELSGGTERTIECDGSFSPLGFDDVPLDAGGFVFPTFADCDGRVGQQSSQA